jgi:hypothetical protein
MVPAINRAIANKAEAITRSVFNTVFRDIAAAIVCSSANFAGDCTAGTYSAIAGGAICPNDCMSGAEDRLGLLSSAITQFYLIDPPCFA